MYSCDAKAEFSAAITLVFSITWLFRNNFNMLIIITIMLINTSVETVIHFFSRIFFFFDEEVQMNRMYLK